VNGYAQRNGFNIFPQIRCRYQPRRELSLYYWP
jgi:hypothetical protein